MVGALNGLFMVLTFLIVAISHESSTNSSLDGEGFTGLWSLGEDMDVLDNWDMAHSPQYKIFPHCS